jgi:ABC-2 type transport system permease protein
MTKLLKVAWYEYGRHVFTRRFMLVLLSVPFFVLLIIGLVLVVIYLESDSKPLGYVDQTGLLANPLPPPTVQWPERQVSFQAYETESLARAALDDGVIQGYYVLPGDYLQTGQAGLVFNEPVKGISQQQFDNFLAVNLLANQPPEVAQRVIEGTTMVVRSADNSREASQKRFMDILLPFFSGLIFFFAMATSSGYILQAVVEEKENRTMEIMVTSVSPLQLMVGKIIGDIAIGFTQMLGWLAFIVLGVMIGSTRFEFLKGVQVSWSSLGLILLVMAPAFVMICALMAAVGATVTEASEGQQVMGIFTIPLYIPYMLISPLMENPNSPLAIGLSFFPLTAPLTIAIRTGFTVIPVWQVLLSIGILVVSAVGALWLAGRAFRLGMLRYGQRLRWKEIFIRRRRG